MTATIPKLTERDFMEQVTQLAEIRGWSWAHFRPAQTAKGWRTPVSGPLGKGWPDLVLVRTTEHGSQGRLVFAELKRDGQRPSIEQKAVLDLLQQTEGEYLGRACEVYVWTPSDWDDIEETLR